MAAAEHRYSRISRRMWRDDKFASLTKMKPSGQALWIYLLTGPHNTSIPGVFVLGIAAMAEELGWPYPATYNAFGELKRAKMLTFDEETRLIWLPNALTHNKPESPNVIAGWRLPWSELPGCALKGSIREALRRYCDTLGPSHARSFQTAIGELPPQPSTNPSGKGLPKGEPKASVQDKGEGSTEDMTDSGSGSGSGSGDNPPTPRTKVEVVVEPKPAPTGGLALVARIVNASEGRVDMVCSSAESVSAFAARLLAYEVDDAICDEMAALTAKTEKFWPTARTVPSPIPIGWFMGTDNVGQWVTPWVGMAKKNVAARRATANRPTIVKTPPTETRPELILGTPEYRARMDRLKAENKAILSAHIDREAMQ